MNILHWLQGRHRKALMISSCCGALAALPFMDISLNLGSGQHANETIIVSLRMFALIIIAHIQAWSLIPRMSSVDALGEKKLVGYSILSAVGLLLYAYLTPWLSWLLKPSVDTAYSCVFASLFVATGALLALALSSCMGINGPLCSGALVVVLLSTSGLQIRSIGFSVLPSNLNDHISVRLIVMLMASIIVVYCWGRTRSGARCLARLH
ncbi:hypothetical protein G1C95_1461 [Bifidobacterium sp. DSM 109957]|uniref:Uncharacterized protein n=1 Tax=Bifidobacterium oedipodis TaxID=2675322 RepID=A0A7Y0EPX5_9BIFI|nr:hypothetical protein [Bifidobacterium sp. DSM 109957]